MGDGLLVVTTTYEPDPSQARRLFATLAASGEPVLVVDNSTSESGRELVRLSCEATGLSLVGEGRNRGTAGALNVGLRAARAQQAGWLLYFDQDSRVDPDHWRRARESAAAAGARTMAMGCRVVHVGENPAPAPTPAALEPATWLISSGTLFRVPQLVELGGFDEALGLDLVDHEICLRIRRADGAVVLDTGRHILHEIGRGGRAIGWRGIRVTYHPRWRRRLMWRNSILLCRRYARSQPRLCGRHLVGRLGETLAGAIVFRDPAWLLAAVRGLGDGLRAPVGIVGLDAPLDTAGRPDLP